MHTVFDEGNKGQSCAYYHPDFTVI